MPDFSSSAGSLPGAQTIDVSDYPSYGTSPDDYKLWFDFVYDRFGATREKVLRRYLVSAGIGIGVFLLGLLVGGITSFISLLMTRSASITPTHIVDPLAFYVREPTAYIFSLDMAYAFHVLRWLSQTYHVRANRLRACFTISDQEYRKLVMTTAEYALNPRRLRLAVGVMVIVCGYFLFYTFMAPPWRDVFGVFYPHAVPLTWRGAYGIPTLFVVLLFACLIVLVSFTAFHLTNTLIFLTRTLNKDAFDDTRHVQPLPSLIEDRFDGILDLSLTGVLQFAGGIILLELLYRAQLDVAGLIFVGAALLQGGLLFFIPRVVARNIVTIARKRLFLQLISRTDTQRPGGEMSGELLDLATLSWDDLNNRSEALRSEVATRSTTISFLGVLGLVASWALTVVLPVINELNLDRTALGALKQLLQRFIPLP